MDDPACSLERLHTTYRHFPIVNQVLAGWRRIYERLLRPHFTSRPATLLDVGCGGGDIVRRLALWAQQDGLELRITAIDPDIRALAFVETLSSGVADRAEETDRVATGCEPRDR